LGQESFRGRGIVTYLDDRIVGEVATRRKLLWGGKKEREVEMPRAHNLPAALF